MTFPKCAGAPLLALAILGLFGAGAEGRDLPRGPAVPSASTGCESFGPDFHKVEGSDTCLRISGSARVEAVIHTGSGAGASFFAGTGKR